MRALVLDHFFEQDIDALRAAAGDAVAFDVMPFETLRAEAMRVFPVDVATGLEAYTRPEFAAHRDRWGEQLREILHDAFTRRPYDAFVSPSDEFFYVRRAPEAVHVLGVPFVAVHKETTISPNTLQVHAEWVRRHSGPIADRMTMCSERHREYTLRTGADPELIAVTGQPRFDFYRHPERWPQRAGDAPTVLFLSYLSGLYHVEGDEPRWAEMHRETEAGLWELARRGWRVVIKPHPQQDWHADRRRIGAEVGELLDRQVVLAQPTDDMRPLLVTSDVVVGFQTTGLYEAMVAGTPIVYTGWHPDARRLAAEMHPFHEWSDILEPVLERERFVAAVEENRGRTLDPAARAKAQALAEEHLGPVDGRASERTIEVLVDEVRRWEAARTPEQQALRDELARRRPPLRPGRTARRALRTGRRRLGAALGR
jgi:hypothetical protein